ncbi:hypothetical protein GOP47_0009893 [Adiantum capillus-veneris]|uniref:Uncharacterized protein n=1 Tax=Adiantum capillus-veneris TaxID=13818 RepID=A0A9D4ZJ52_ADICA|nr:hypothetical protein GOP47_0009893 [Adiantum capillus-veneris]
MHVRWEPVPQSEPLVSQKEDYAIHEDTALLSSLGYLQMFGASQDGLHDLCVGGLQKSTSLFFGAYLSQFNRKPWPHHFFLNKVSCIRILSLQNRACGIPPFLVPCNNIKEPDAKWLILLQKPCITI